MTLMHLDGFRCVHCRQVSPEESWTFETYADGPRKAAWFCPVCGHAHLDRNPERVLPSNG